MSGQSYILLKFFYLASLYANACSFNLKIILVGNFANVSVRMQFEPVEPKKNDLLSGFWGILSCGTQLVVPSGKDSVILPSRVANHGVGFGSTYQLTELAIF